MKEHLEQILLEVSKSPLIDNGELAKAYRLVISKIHEALMIQRAGIWFVKADYSEINCQLLIDTYHHAEIEELAISATQYPKYFAALRAERAIYAHDAHTHAATAEFSEGYLKPLEITSMLDVPIRHKGEMIGIICCEHIGIKRVWSENEAGFVGSMADLVGRAINANAFKLTAEKLKTTNDQLEQTVITRTTQLLESEKMAALGNLVAGVAHEVNTPLGISITASTALLENMQNIETVMQQGKLSENLFVDFLAENKELLSLLNNNLSRAAELVRNFKKTAVDHSDKNMHLFDLEESVRYLLLSLTPETNKVNVQISLDIPTELSIYSYPSAWTQIISNLVLNSCLHAFEKSLQPQIDLQICQQNNAIYLNYQDNGCGIPKENLNKVILPFFTTKRGYGGTGLGLSIVYNLVNEQLNGSMVIESEEGKGVLLKITCPITSLSSEV